MEQQKNLLESLYDQVGCEFLSDLRSKEYQVQALLVLENIEPDSVSLEDWKECLSYLFDEAICLRSLEDVRAFLAEKKTEQA